MSDLFIMTIFLNQQTVFEKFGLWTFLRLDGITNSSGHFYD